MNLETRPPIELIDPSVLALLHRVFAGTSGIELLARMLRFASVKQRALDLPESGLVDVASITTPSVAAFAHTIGCGKDTLLRHLAMFRALRIMTQQRRDGQTILQFPLTVYRVSLDTLSDLNRLAISGRAKQQQLARSVRDRYQLAYGLPDLAPATTEQGIVFLLTEIDSVLKAKRTTSARRSVLQRKIAQVLTLLAQQGDRRPSFFLEGRDQATQKGDRAYQCTEAEAQKGDRISPLPQREGDLVQQEGEFHYQRPVSSEDLMQQKGDLDVSPFSTQGDLTPQEGDLSLHIASTQGDFLPEKGDLDTQAAQKGDFSLQKGDFQAVTPPSIIDIVSNNKNNSSRKDDSDIDVPAPAKSQDSTGETGNEHASAEQISEAKALAMYLDGSPRNVGSFVNRLKQNHVAVRASVIEVLVRTHYPDYRGKPKNRGACFNTSFKVYAQPGTTIPPAVQRWLATDLSWTEIDQALAKEAQERAALPVPSISSAERERSELVLQPAQKTWMDLAEAEFLVRQIEQVAVNEGYMLTVQAVEDHGIAIVKGIWDMRSLGGTRMPLQYKNPGAWERHVTKVREHIQQGKEQH